MNLFFVIGLTTLCVVACKQETQISGQGQKKPISQRTDTATSKSVTTGKFNQRTADRQDGSNSSDDQRENAEVAVSASDDSGTSSPSIAADCNFSGSGGRCDVINGVTQSYREINGRPYECVNGCYVESDVASQSDGSIVGGVYSSGTTQDTSSSSPTAVGGFSPAGG